jgi:HEPN domain-containing protein
MSLIKQLYKLRGLTSDDRFKWLLDADLTYCSGRFLLISDNFIFRSSGGYLLHQASEKYLKTLRKVVRPQIRIDKHGHDLTSILGDLKEKIDPSSFKKTFKVTALYRKRRETSNGEAASSWGRLKGEVVKHIHFSNLDSRLRKSPLPR